MNSAIISQVIDQLQAMPQPLQLQVLEFARTLLTSQLRGVPGKQLLCFAGSIPIDELNAIQEAIKQDCEQVDLNEW
jgi:hypothetical protein